MASKRSKKTSARQYEIMVNFLENHKEMVSGKLTSQFTAKRRDELWEQLTNILNADGFGPQKTVQKWRRTWIDIKSEAKNKAADRSKHIKKTGGGATCEPLPPLFEKIVTIIDPVMITGDGDIAESDHVVEDIVINAEEASTSAASKDATSTPLAMVDVEMPASISMFRTPSSSSHKRGLNRKVSSRDFSKMMDIENDKAESLKSISVSLARANELKEMEIEAYKERTNVFLSIANAFLQK